MNFDNSSYMHYFFFIVLFFTDVDGDWATNVNLYPDSFKTRIIGLVHSNNVV